MGDDVKRVVVGIPSNDHVHADFACCLATMATYSVVRHHKDFRIMAFLNHKTSNVFRGRNNMVREVQSIPHPITHLLMIDSDMTFPADLVARMLARGKPIVGIDASTRRAPYRRVARKTSFGTWELGAGILLLEMSIFQKIPFPWFVSHYKENGDFQSEDHDFCEKATRAGFPPFLDEGLSSKVGHIGAMTFTLQMADAAQTAGGQA